jgi:hypothetical protein
MSLHLVETVEHESEERSTVVGLLWRRFGPAAARQRAMNREQAVDDAHGAGEIAWRWRGACEGSGLARQIFTPTGPALSIPTIGRIRLGPPTSFTVRLLPDQLPGDLAAVAPRLASAMEVPEIRVRPLATGWVAVELLTTSPHRLDADAPGTRPFAQVA